MDSAREEERLVAWLTRECQRASIARRGWEAQKRKLKRSLEGYMGMEHELWTLRDVQEFLKVSRSSVIRHLTRELGAFRVGKDYRFERRKVVAWVEREDLN